MRQIQRAGSIKTQFMTENMEYFDLWVTDQFLARVWQHEIDHSNGIHLVSDMHNERIYTELLDVKGQDIKFSEEFEKQFYIIAGKQKQLEAASKVNRISENQLGVEMEKLKEESIDLFKKEKKRLEEAGEIEKFRKNQLNDVNFVSSLSLIME